MRCLASPPASLIALLAAALPAPAAPSPSPAPRDEIVVTATPLADVVQPATVLDDEALLLRVAPTLGETLERELGVSSSYFGPAASRPVIRGLGGSRVTVLSDSVSTLDVSDISPDHAVAVEPLLADGIEVIRGPATLQFGSAAAGGVVNVLDSRVPSRLPDEPLAGAFEVRGDSAPGELAEVGRLDGGVGQLAWHLDAYNRDTDDLDIPGYATADPAERPADEQRGTLRNSSSEGDGQSAGVAWIAERAELGIGISTLDSTYGLPGPEEEEGDPGEVLPYPGPFLVLEQTRVDVRGAWRPGGPVERVKLAFGTGNYEHTEFEPTGEPATRFRNDASQLRVEAVHARLGGWRGVAGVQVDDRKFSALGAEAILPETRTRSQGYFVTEQLERPWGQVEVGLRYEPLEHDAGGTLPDYDDAAWSGALGIAWDITAAWRLTGHVSRTERHPAGEELYVNGAHLATRQYEVGLLVPADGKARKETSSNVDIGIARRLGAVQWSVAVFRNAIGDYIYQAVTTDEVDGLPVAPYAQADATFWGAEAELTLPLFEGRAWRTSGRLFSDLVRAELDDGGDLPRIPPWRAGVELETRRGPWSLGADATWHARQDDVSSFRTDAFTLVGANVTREFATGPLDWEVFARGTNLADQEGRRSASFLAAYVPLPGRSLELGFRARF